jgi:hypothetical protein
MARKLCAQCICHVIENANFLGSTVMDFVSEYVQLAKMKLGQS